MNATQTGPDPRPVGEEIGPSATPVRRGAESQPEPDYYTRLYQQVREEFPEMAASYQAIAVLKVIMPTNTTDGGITMLQYNWNVEEGDLRLIRWEGESFVDVFSPTGRECPKTLKKAVEWALKDALELLKLG